MSDNGYLSPIIGDGYDRTATIPARPGVHSAIELKYRPVSADEIQAAASARLAEPKKAPAQFYAELYASHIVEWDIRDNDGELIEPKGSALRRMWPEVYDDIEKLLTTGRLNDNTPSLSDDEGN